MTFSSFPDDPEYTLTEEELQGQQEALANIDPVSPTPDEAQAASLAELEIQDPSTEGQSSAATVSAQSNVTQPSEPTGSQQAAPQPTEEMVEFNGKMYPSSDIVTNTNIFGQEITNLTPEAARRENAEERQEGGSPLDKTMYGPDFGGGIKEAAEANLAGALGTADTLIGIGNFFLGPTGVKIPTPSKSEDQDFEAIRTISSVVIPELIGLGAIRRLQQGSRLIQGSRFLQNPTIRWWGNRVAEAGVTGLVSTGAPVNEQPGNIANLAPKIPILNRVMPKQLDWIHDNWGTFEHQSTDYIRAQNTRMDVGLGFTLPFLWAAGTIGKAAIGKKLKVANKAKRAANVENLELNAANQNATVTTDDLAITGNNANTEEWLRQADPEQIELNKQTEAIWNARYEEGVVNSPWVDLDEAAQASTVQRFYDEGMLVPTANMGVEDHIARYIRDQDAALDELGRYNMTQIDSLDQSVAIKGVNDLFDYNEVGMRTLDDFGVVGAKIDGARILNNAGSTNGRIRNLVSPAAMKYAAKNLDSVDDISLGLARNLDEANDFTANGRGWKLTNQMMDDAADQITIDFLDPTLDVNGLRRMLDPVLGKADDGTEILFPRGNELVKNQLIKMGKEFNDMTIARAQAYVGTSLAGQVSDLAEAARFSRGNVAVTAAQEKIAENMAFLMRLKASSNYYMNNKASIRNLWDTKKAVTKQTPDELIANYDTAMKAVNSEIDQAIIDLKWTFKNDPELGKAIMELYEATDGRVYDISTIQDTANQSLKWSRPRFSNADPKTPNLVGQAIRGNWFNSMLSSVGTPVRATLGNFGGIIDEPVSYFAGAALRWDMESISKGFYAYRSLGDIHRKAFPLMGRLYTKAAQNIDNVERATDIDFVIKQDAKLEGLRRLANNEAAKGNTGYSVMLEQYISLNELAMDPVLRFNSNAMTGLDGLPQSMYANSEARFMALEEMARKGDDFNPDEILSIANKEYNSMFDSTGSLLKDKAAKYGADRISLRRNTVMSDGLNNFLKKYPSARLLFPFPGVQANIISLVDETIPLPLRSWQKDINDLAYTSMKTFSEEPGLVRRVLENRGYNVDTMDEVAQLGAITRLKNKTVGRKALSTILIGGSLYAVSQDRLTGEGLYDKQAQKARELAKIPKNSFKMPNGEWIAIDSILGPGYGRWVSTVATAAENFNYLGEQNFSNLEKKLGFIFGAAIKDDSGLSAVEPIFQMLNGESYGINRFAAGQVNSLGPLGGFRNEMGNVLNGGLRIVNNDIASMIKNRNKALGLVTPKADNPYIINPLDGSVPNQYTFMQRFWNTISDIKVTPELTENGAFLQKAGMSYSEMFKTKDGVDLTPDEQERLYEIVGERQILNNELTKIRKFAERINYIERLKEYRASGATDDQLQEFLTINNMWDKALKQAKADAFLRLDFEIAQPINQRIQQRKRERVQSQIGDITTFIDEIPTR